MAIKPIFEETYDIRGWFGETQTSAGWFDRDFSELVSGSTGQMKVWNGSSWVAKPVKVWNGSSWSVKPTKRWNGSSWVVTPY